MCSGVGYNCIPRFHPACSPGGLPLVASVTGGPGASYFEAQLGSGKHRSLWQLLLQPVEKPLWAGFAGSYLRLCLFSCTI